MDSDILQSFAKLLGLIQQLIKQVEDLQDLVADQQTLVVQFQTDLANLAEKKIHLNQVFIFKNPAENFATTIPDPKKMPLSQPIFWLPMVSDPTTEGAKN